MDSYVFSKHAIEQMAARQIPREVVDEILKNPEKTEAAPEEHTIIYQSIVNFEERKYLVRVFINIDKSPALIITVYRTSKFEKYL